MALNDSGLPALPDTKAEGLATVSSDDGESGGVAVDVLKSGSKFDQRDMMRMGKKQELNRNFGFVSILGFTCVLMATWEGQLTASMFGLQNGGLAGLIWTYLGTFVGFLTVIASMSEMASIAPTSGGQYHWVSEFAPASCQRFLSYISGWVCVLGWQTGITSIAYLAATQIQGLLVLNDSAYVFEKWQGTLLVIAIAGFSVIFNTIFVKHLPMVEGVVLILHIFGFFAILIPLWVLSPRTPASQVFTQFTDGGNWGNMGLSCLVGMLSPVFAFIGPDSAVHMSEELKDASRVLPQAMMATLWLNGAMGFVMLVTFCFCLGNVEEILATPTGSPFIQVFFNSTNSHAGTTVMTLILTVLVICGAISNVATASRQLFAFARDNGLPFSGFLSYVRPGWDIPLNAVLVSLVITCLLSLINIGSAEAFNAVASLGTASLISSYIISITCFRIRKWRGPPLPPARWSMGRVGPHVNIFAILYLILIFIMSFFPEETPVTGATMNWNIAIYGAVIIFSIIYYYGWGRRIYVGPVMYVRQT